MIKGDKEYLDQVVKTHHCPEHNNPLVVAWHAGEDAYVIRCGAGHFPDEVTRELSPIEEHKAGQREAHQPIASLLPKADLETGELLSPEQVQALIDYANKYGLDAYRGHVMMMYGTPYIGLDGYLYHANKKKIPFSLTGRPLSELELIQRGYEIGDMGYLSKVTRHDTSGTFEGVGFIRRSELTEMSKKKPDRLRYPVVADKPGNIVQKRADWQALRRAFPIGETEEVKEDSTGSEP